MKKIQKISIVCVIALIALVLVKDVIIKALAAPIASSVLGAPVRIGYLSWNLIGSDFLIKDVVIGAPAGFPDDPIIDIAHVNVKYDLGSLLNKQNHFQLIDINVREINMVANQDKKINVQELKPFKHAATKDDGNKDKEKTSSMDAPVNFSIDVLKINVDGVWFKNYASGTVKKNAYSVDLKNKTYKNIHGVGDLMLKVVSSQASVATLVNMPFMAGNQLKKGVGFVFDTTNNVLGETGGILKKIIQTK